MLLEKAAKGVLQSEEFTEVKDNIKLVRKDLMVLKKKADTNLNKLEKQKTNVTNKIKLYRQKINQALDKLEQATVKELEQAVERGKKFAEEDRKLFSDMVATLDAVLNMVIKTKGNDQGESAVFVGIKRAKQRMIEGQRVINFTKNSIQQEAFRFVPDPQILAWLKSLKQLGSFPHQQRSYAGVLMGRYNARTKIDSAQCDIFGCDILPDGRLLLADWDNKSVKLMSRDYNVTDQCAVPGNPVDICCINPEEAVASLTLQKMLQFIHVDTTVTTTRTLALDEHCRGIAYHDGELFVVCGGFKNEIEACVRVFNVAGEPVRVIKTNNRGQQIFVSPIAIAIDPVGTLYHITDGQRGIITMTSSNDVVSVIANKDVAWPCGVCVDTEGNTLICNAKSNSVIQMSTLAKFCTFLRYEDGIKNPHAVCFDQNNMRLIVTSKSSMLAVYQLMARDMTEVAKDVKPTIPKEEKTETTEPEDSKNTQKQDVKDSNKNTEEKNIIEEALKQSIDDKAQSEPNQELNKKKDKQTKKTEEESSQKKTPAFVQMAEKVLNSEQLLRAISEVTKANTAPENGPKKGSKQIPPKTGNKKVELPQINQSKGQQPKQTLSSNQKSGTELKEQSAKEIKPETAESSTRKSVDTLSTKRPDTRQSRDASIKPNRRPLTASTDSTLSKPRSQTSEGKPKSTNLPPAINAITPRIKEKTQMKTARSTSVSRSLTKPNLTGKDRTMTEAVSKDKETTSNQKSEANTEVKENANNDNQPQEDNTNDNTIAETGNAENVTENPQQMDQKDSLIKQNQRTNTAIQGLRNKKVAPSPRPLTRESTSIRAGRQTTRSVIKT